ncbi:unnamed protein product [Zymoseptoria tritici ST99CH_1A5]|uniref:Secreted protein n=4 Tax=Zymoseptoria tritici TaxID=1047171 RepID=F9XKE2_ZYMTI|nr:uncharacterized protein MYCGRDRAFT_95958 [Zymoseptoria tritici IPO323]EGP84510.1 hypothetical protein MYCGRDRAFT_95958 [Zymoseptoria tritici IPO323]SMQ54349.1 unnamed protein product [Zymoseptoria tritici ST99CH_3D7]SMR58778.1 unnamed protein product [Zymoseptoria tritici ST99CH_1E4]SMY27996.1 unnamed protein product [Zymoseptoria tritici ST99CH_1A5]
MQFSIFRFLLLALVVSCLISSVMGEPLAKKAKAKPPVKTIQGGKYECKARRRGYVINYNVRIGRAWNKKQCKQAYNALHWVGRSAYKCNKMAGGHMHLKFNAMWDSQKSLNEALNKVFPVIANNNGGFNCPRQ